VLEAQACNPSYSGGRDQEDFHSKSVWTNNLRDPILMKLITKKRLEKKIKQKRACAFAQGVGPEFKL
jgi:hypothetical protein